MRTLTLTDTDLNLTASVRFDRFDSFDQKPQFVYRIEVDGIEPYESDDLRLGAATEPIERLALGALLSFLGAYVESVNYERRMGRDSDNSDLFPDRFRVWAESLDSDSLSMIAIDLEGDEN